MPFVVDASLALAWFFEDEATPRTNALLERVQDEAPVVPALWRAEMLNAFRSAVLRKRISKDVARAHGERVLRFAFEFDDAGRDELRDAFRLALEQRVSVYDALYLELCGRSGLGLATNDRGLGRVATRLGIEVL
ncbi:MAG TPA: type II toxin-antitoxin system VapC family toxin [Candidatus Tyrphobacter sp.]